MQSSYSRLRTTEIVRYGGQDEHLAQAASGCFWLYRLTHLTRGYGGEPSWPVKSVNLHRDKTQHQQQSTQHRNQRKAIVQHFNHQYPFILMAKKSLHSICSKKIYYRNKYNIWNSICIILLQYRQHVTSTSYRRLTEEHGCQQRLHKKARVRV